MGRARQRPFQGRPLHVVVIGARNPHAHTAFEKRVETGLYEAMYTTRAFPGCANAVGAKGMGHKCRWKSKAADVVVELYKDESGTAQFPFQAHCGKSGTSCDLRSRCNAPPGRLASFSRRSSR